MTYTVEMAIATGKKDEKYGPEYMIKFAEDARPVKMNFKNDTPKAGDTEEGEIIDGKYGAYFKRGGSKPAYAGGEKKEWKDNSDGQRQGMCMNNAASYVNTLAFEKALTDVEWADLVYSYANTLYQKGDLTQTPEGSQEEVIEGNPFDKTKQ